MTARVWCTRTEESIFGSAGAWLRSDGVVREFVSLAEAKAEAERLNARGIENCYYHAVELKTNTQPRDD
jgi:hypothetical protein